MIHHQHKSEEQPDAAHGQPQRGGAGQAVIRQCRQHQAQKHKARRHNPEDAGQMRMGIADQRLARGGNIVHGFHQSGKDHQLARALRPQPAHISRYGGKAPVSGGAAPLFIHGRPFLVHLTARERRQKPARRLCARQTDARQRAVDGDDGRRLAPHIGLVGAQVSVRLHQRKGQHHARHRHHGQESIKHRRIAGAVVLQSQKPPPGERRGKGRSAEQ